MEGNFRRFFIFPNPVSIDRIRFMSISLIEKLKGGGQKSELSFDKSPVRIGRDGSCDVSFERSEFPMVSRHHAELRFEDGGWILVDLDSTYGSYVNDDRITSPRKFSVGDTIRFGDGGPELVVIWFDESAPLGKSKVVPNGSIEFEREPTAIPNPSFGKISYVGIDQAASSKKLSGVAAIEFIDESDSRKPFVVTAAETILGRDASCSVIFDETNINVSRRHAIVRYRGGQFSIEDNKSFNGTFLNGVRITAPKLLSSGDEIQLGTDGPRLRFVSSARKPASSQSESGKQLVQKESQEPPHSSTIVFNPKAVADYSQTDRGGEPSLVATHTFAGGTTLNIGRHESNEIRLDGLQISNRHARLVSSGSGVSIEDLNSTNGVFIAGRRVGKQRIEPESPAQIGPYILQIDAAENIHIYDTRSKTQIDAIDLSVTLRDRSATKVLDRVSLAIKANEFVGVFGASGAGKSILMNALNGSLKPSDGKVYVNEIDVHRYFDSVKGSIGFVPQSESIHSELSVSKALYYVAKLRLSADVSASEVRNIVDEVLEQTGLIGRKSVAIRQLSGGQRKRVAIAAELITKPSAIFLDEPTTGLDPGTEHGILNMFRQIAESGRTVVMTTHSTGNLQFFDKVVFLSNGRLVFFGTPDEALAHFGVKQFVEIYDRIAANDDASNADNLRDKYLASGFYQQHIAQRLSQLSSDSKLKSGSQKNRSGVRRGFRQLFTLARRYLDILFKDKRTLLVLMIQAPLIAMMTAVAVGSDDPRDFIFFVLTIVSIWFGISVSAREIVRERKILQRERMVNLGVLPYVVSKLIVLLSIVGLQCVLFFVPLKLLDVAGLISMPGEYFGLPQLFAMLLTSAVGVGIGLLISSVASSSRMATVLVPLVLIPQLLFGGLGGVPYGVGKVVGLAMPVTWSFDTIKRFSTLDTLEPEGADPDGATKGLGLFKFIDAENEAIVEKAKSDFEEYKQRFGNDSSPPDISSDVDSILKVPADLSRYVTFLHPWMNEVVNQFVLVIMFGLAVVGTFIGVRFKDAGKMYR